jgi:hypothetical protein
MGQQTFAVAASPTALVEQAAPPSPTSVPDWLTDGRRRRILELVRAGVDPRLLGPVTADVVMQQLPTMAKEMKAVGATVADLPSVLCLIGVQIDPVSGRLRIA